MRDGEVDSLFDELARQLLIRSCVRAVRKRLSWSVPLAAYHGCTGR